jgi:hypothetical protein
MGVLVTALIKYGSRSKRDLEEFYVVHHEL